MKHSIAMNKIEDIKNVLYARECETFNVAIFKLIVRTKIFKRCTIGNQLRKFFSE